MPLPVIWNSPFRVARITTSEMPWWIAMAMLINNMVAGLGGILIPVTLDKLDVDPAVSSAVFVTTLTDVMGFFSFLGLATIWGV